MLEIDYQTCIDDEDNVDEYATFKEAFHGTYCTYCNSIISVCLYIVKFHLF